MNEGPLIAPTDLRDFAKAHGWMLVPEALADRLYVLSHPRFGLHQLVFPMETTAPDYLEAVHRAVERISALEGRSVASVWRAVQVVNDDTLIFRLVARRDEMETLPLSFAGSVIGGMQQMLLAAASTVLKPQHHHPRLSRTEAQQLVSAARFRHTEAGSFVVKASCPLNAVDVQAPLSPGEENAPFVRRTTLVIRRALRELVAAIEADALEQLVDRARTETSVLSSNFCQALTRFQDEGLENTLDIDTAWAASWPAPEEERKAAPVRIQWDYFPRIEEVQRALRVDEQAQSDLFVGTVERLDGDLGADGRRAGDVVLSLITGNESLRARVSLSADDYAQADQAHMVAGSVILVKGKLTLGRKINTMTEVKSFQVITPRKAEAITHGTDPTTLEE